MSAVGLQHGEPARGRMTWAGYTGAALVLFALLAFSINNSWDLWTCTVPAVLGGGSLGLWGWARRAEIQRRLGLRGVKYGGQTLASGGLLLGVLVLLNFVGARHNATFDLTESGSFTLAPETRQVLKTLPYDVRLLAFYPEHRRGQAVDLLRRYADACPRLSYEFIDPDSDPDLATSKGVTAYGTVAVQVSPKPGAPLRSGKPLLVEPEPGANRQLILSEEKLTNALLKVSRGGTKTVYFLEGHGEAPIDSGALTGYSRLKAVLQGQAFLVKRLSLGQQDGIPSDCSVLVIAGPSKELRPAEEAALERYLKAGGKALAMVDPAPGAGLEELLGRWGVDVHRDLIIDPSGAGRLAGGGPAVPLVQTYDRRNPVTQDFREATLFPLSRSVWPKKASGDAQPFPLAQTSDGSFMEPFDGKSEHLRFNPAGDKKGPAVVAVGVTRAAKEGKEARLVVTGTSNFVTNRFFDRAGNGDFFLACVNWLAEQEAMIALRPKPPQNRVVQLTEQEGRGIFWLVMALPVLALGAGGIVQWRRR